MEAGGTNNLAPPEEKTVPLGNTRLSQIWRQGDKLHRNDGPALEAFDGSYAYYLNGQLHRNDGPAIKRADGSQEWWLGGKQVTEQQHLELTATFF